MPETSRPETHEPETLEPTIRRMAAEELPLALSMLREAVRLPADHVDRPPGEGGDPACGLSNHEGPRLEYLKRRVVELGAVDRPEDAAYDRYGNLRWTLEDPDDGVADEEKIVVMLDGHVDTVQALRSRWHEAIGGGIDPYNGLVDSDRVDRGFLRRELGWLPPDEEWPHLVFGRGAADQLAGVVCQVVASKILRRLRPLGALRGVRLVSYATVAEEDNDGGGPMYVFRHELPGRPAGELPDVLILTEPTGSAAEGALGIYRGQRGRMQIELEVTGKSCHGSMPWEGRNPLEFGAAIVAEAAAAAGSGFGDDPFLGPGSRTASWSSLATPSDCAVPERLTVRFDRRLTAGERAEAALRELEALPSVAAAREAGLRVEVRVPLYDTPTWTGQRPGNQQIYPGWITPEDHPAIAAALDCYRRVVAPSVAADAAGGGLRRRPRAGRWTFSTDGVGVPLPAAAGPAVPESKRWVEVGGLHHPPMFGIGPGHEENTHKIGECVDSREIPLAIAFLARFPSLYRRVTRAGDSASGG